MQRHLLPWGDRPWEITLDDYSRSTRQRRATIRSMRNGLKLIDGGLHDTECSIGEQACLPNVSSIHKKTAAPDPDATLQEVLYSVSRLPEGGVLPLRDWLLRRGYLLPI